MSMLPFKGRCLHCGHDHGAGLPSKGWTAHDVQRNLPSAQLMETVADILAETHARINFLNEKLGRPAETDMPKRHMARLRIAYERAYNHETCAACHTPPQPGAAQ